MLLASIDKSNANPSHDDLPGVVWIPTLFQGAAIYLLQQLVVTSVSCQQVLQALAGITRKLPQTGTVAHAALDCLHAAADALVPVPRAVQVLMPCRLVSANTCLVG